MAQRFIARKWAKRMEAPQLLERCEKAAGE
jgi:hypothetical protein